MGNSLSLEGRVAIVTGGTRGIGRAIAERFLEAGAHVVVCGRTAPAAPIVSSGRLASMPAGVQPAENVAAASEGKPEVREAVFTQADVREADAARAVVQFAVERYGRLDVLVNNAGGSPPADAATASPRFFSAIVSLNLLAPLYLAQAANAVMQGQAEGGVIINVASVSGLRASPGTAAYGAAKAGLLNLTESLAVEWAPRVRVVAVTPGPVRTEQSQLHYGDEAGVAAVNATVPMGRMAEPRDVADACLLLASPLAGYVTGANLLVHGGGERPAFLAASNAKRG
jgi:NAD(P)-dependent dehydrogenase (short-subunit alcohol dehydrogenase family)